MSLTIEQIAEEALASLAKHGLCLPIALLKALNPWRMDIYGSFGLLKRAPAVMTSGLAWLKPFRVRRR